VTTHCLILGTSLFAIAVATTVGSTTPQAETPFSCVQSRRVDGVRGSTESNPSPDPSMREGSDARTRSGGAAGLRERPSSNRESGAAQDTSDVPYSGSAGVPVTRVDLIRASQMQDHEERIRVLEGYLNRPMRTEYERAVFQMLVSSCKQSGDSDGAAFYGEEALRTYPDDWAVLLELSSMYAELEDPDLDKGIDYAERAVAALEAAKAEAGEGRVSIFVGICLSDWGWMLFRKGQSAEAESMLERAVEKRKDPKAYERLGRVKADAGKLEAAKDAFAMSLALSSGERTSAMEGIKEIAAELGEDETDVDAIVGEKRREIAEQKRETIKKQAKIEPRPAPDFNVTTLTGESLSLESLGGSVVVLDFWATWCGPCRLELPVIQKTYESFQDKKVVFIAATVDADTSKVRPFVKANGLTMPVAFAQSMGRDYGAGSIPTLFLIDAKGMIRYVHTGYHPDLEEILPLEIEELLQEL